MTATAERSALSPPEIGPPFRFGASGASARVRLQSGLELEITYCMVLVGDQVVAKPTGTDLPLEVASKLPLDEIAIYASASFRQWAEKVWDEGSERWLPAEEAADLYIRAQFQALARQQTAAATASRTHRPDDAALAQMAGVMTRGDIAEKYSVRQETVSRWLTDAGVKAQRQRPTVRGW